MEKSRCVHRPAECLLFNSSVAFTHVWQQFFVSSLTWSRSHPLQACTCCTWVRSGWNQNDRTPFPALGVSHMVSQHEGADCLSRIAGPQLLERLGPDIVQRCTEQIRLYYTKSACKPNKYINSFFSNNSSSTDRQAVGQQRRSLPQPTTSQMPRKLPPLLTECEPYATKYGLMLLGTLVTNCDEYETLIPPRVGLFTCTRESYLRSITGSGWLLGKISGELTAPD